MEQTWAMSEHESRSKARELALEAMRLRAANAVGKIVEATTTLKDGKLKEEVRTVGVSMVRLTQVTDSLQLGADGRGLLRVSATVDVDETELIRRAQQMNQDRDTARQVSQLQAENEKLRRNLGALSTTLKAASTTADVVPLLKQQQELMAALRRNESNIGNTFTPGTLLAMANQDGESWQRDREQIDERVFEALLAMPVQARLVGVERLGGDRYQARVQVGWSIPMPSIKGVLEKHFDGLEVQTQSNRVSVTLTKYATKRSVNADRTLNYLFGHFFAVELNLGGASVELPLVYANREFFGTNCGSGAHQPDAEAKKLVFCSQSHEPGAQVNVNGKGQDNPIRLQLSAQQAASARALRVFLLLRRPGGEVIRKEIEPRTSS